MNEGNRRTSLEKEIMLQVNERLFQQGLLSRELYEAAKVRIVDGHS